MKPFRTYALVAIAALVAGCGGGSSSPPTQSTQQPTQTNSTASVQFTIVIPSANASATARHPAYISASTKSASIAVTPNGASAGTPKVVNCTTTCSTTINAAIGSDTFAVNLYDAQNAGGSLL